MRVVVEDKKEITKRDLYRYHMKLIADASREERDAIYYSDMGRTVIFTRKDITEGTGLLGLVTAVYHHATNLSFTVDNLFSEQAVPIHTVDLDELIRMKREIKENLDRFYERLSVVLGHGGTHTYEFKSV